MKSLYKYLALLASMVFAYHCQAQSYLKFSGTNSYVSFGNNAKLGLSSFTLECWFQRLGTGATTSTGTGGITAVPLITKGRGEADGSNLDCNYFFGINTSGNVLGADFEEGSSGSTPGLNHPVSGTTAIQNNVWYHAAATYDGYTWKLYLNGKLEASFAVNQPVQNLSIQHSAIASALTSNGTAQGYFNGNIDEVRVWNYAKTQSELISTINQRLYGAQTGMVSRWGLDEGSGLNVRDTSGNAVHGSIKGTAYAWQSGAAPFNVNFAPEMTIISSPACAKDSAEIRIQVKDYEKDSMMLKIYGRPKIKGPGKFVFIGIPDTQFYTETTNGGSNEIFKIQTKWIVAQKDILNIKHAAQLGDCVQNGDNGGNDIEWKRADTSMKIIEDPVTTKLKDGIPYTMNVGNHDQSPGGDAKGATVLFNQYFGVQRFNGRNYWGGNYRTNNDNNYQLFSANGIDFISISLEYDTNADTNVLKWADSLLKVHKTRKGIIVSHWIINSDGSFGAQGSAVYNKLKVNPNLMLMLCGHINPNGEARRSDVYNGVTVHTLLSDYQDRTKGGNGWLRIMTIDPDKNSMDVKTYSPYLNQYETDANSEFTISNLNLFPGAPYSLISSQLITGGDKTITYTWKNLLKDSTYEWYAELSDGKSTVTGETSLVSTKVPTVYLGKDTSACTGSLIDAKNIGNSYLWNTGNRGQSILVKTSGTYSVKVTQPQSMCTATDTIKVVINYGPVLNLAKNLEACGSRVVNIGKPGYQVLWSTKDTAQFINVKTSGLYKVTVTDTKTGCFSKDSTSVKIKPYPVVNLGSDKTTCGLAVFLDAGNSGSAFTWNDNSKYPFMTVEKSGTYSVTVRNVDDCESSDTVKVTIKQVPSSPVITGQQDYCEGEPLKPFNATGSNISWYSDSMKTQVLAVGNSYTPQTTSGKIYYADQTVDGCTGKLSGKEIFIHAKPVVKINMSKTEYFHDDTAVTIAAEPEGGSFKGKGVSGNKFNPVTAGVGGPYTITYTFTTAKGCKDSAKIILAVKTRPVVDLELQEGKQALIFYPNPPDKDMVFFNKTINLRVVDPAGKMLMDLNSVSYLDISALKNGVYFLQAGTGEILRLVINR